MPPLGAGTLVTIGVVMSVVGMVGAVGNLTVIVLLLRHKKLQTRANMYVLNLATADLLMCLGNFPLLVTSSFSGRWVAGYTGCKLYSFCGGLSGFVSINTLTAMACDRYNAIYRHKGLRRSKPKRYSLGFLLSLWIYSLLWALPPFVGWGSFVLDGGQISCCFDYLNRSTSNVAYIIAIFVFCFGIQVVVILFCYCSIVRVVCHHGHLLGQANIQVLLYHNHYHHHSLQNHLDSPHHHHHQHHHQHHTHTRSPAATPTDSPTPLHEHFTEVSKCQKKKKEGRGRKRRRVEVLVTRLVVVITVSFFLAWMPFAVVALLGVFGDASVITPLVSLLPGMLAKISTVINPVLYAMGHPQYRSLLLAACRPAPPPAAGKGRGRRKGGAEQTTRGMLSSVYFATVLRPSDNGVTPPSQDMSRQPTFASTSVV